MNQRLVTRFESDTPEYTRAFQTFLAHTDQKEQALGWLERTIGSLDHRRVAIDAGAGTGKLTAWLADRFERVIGIEPNLSLCETFAATCPEISLFPETILSAEPKVQADFVLCSHVLYYIPHDEWFDNLRKMVSWLHPGGMLVIAIQNSETDCMFMIDHFVGERLSLHSLAEKAKAELSDACRVELETVSAHVKAEHLQTACEIAEFMLNVRPLVDPPSWRALEDYVENNFKLSGGDYKFSCHQDFMKVTRIC